jgi:hypothetical protein
MSNGANDSSNDSSVQFEADAERLILASAGLLALVKAGEPQVKGDEILQKASEYLQQFESWVAALQADNPFSEGSEVDPVKREMLRGRVELLQSNHQRLVQALTTLKGDVVDQLSEIHRRSKALKTYIDRFPSRISITGKRKG